MPALASALAALLAVPAGARAEAPDLAPQVDIIHSEGRSPAKPAEGAEERARQAALKDAVFQALKLANPDENRLRVYVRRLLPHYERYIFSSRTVQSRREGDEYVCLLEVYVLHDVLRKDLLAQGLKSTGEHLELMVLHAVLGGGSPGDNPLRAGEVVSNRAYSGMLLGVAARYYFLDPVFAEGSALLLTSPVEVGTYRSPAGIESPLRLTQFSPFTFSAGYKWFDRHGVRLTTTVGRSFTRIRWETPAGQFPNKYATDRQFVSSWVFGGGVQWAFSRRVGLGVSADWRNRNHFNALTEKMYRSWTVVSQLVFSL